MSIVVVEQDVGGGVGTRACAVRFAAENSKKVATRTLVKIAQKRIGWFIRIAPLTQDPDFKLKVRRVVRLRPTGPVPHRAISGPGASRTRTLALEVTIRLVTSKRARNPVIVLIGLKQ